jgi:hypothetical protein
MTFPHKKALATGGAGFKTVGWAILFFLLAAGVADIGAGISCGIKYVLKIGS